MALNIEVANPSLPEEMIRPNLEKGRRFIVCGRTAGKAKGSVSKSSASLAKPPFIRVLCEFKGPLERGEMLYNPVNVGSVVRDCCERLGLIDVPMEYYPFGAFSQEPIRINREEDGRDWRPCEGRFFEIVRDAFVAPDTIALEDRDERPPDRRVVVVDQAGVEERYLCHRRLLGTIVGERSLGDVTTLEDGTSAEAQRACDELKSEIQAGVPL